MLILSAFAAGSWILEPPLHAAAPAKPAASEEEPRSAARPGPWGQLEVSPIYLEAPDYMLAHVPKPNSVPHWSFVGADGRHIIGASPAS